ncbi:Uncharacterised protein [Bordetella pertussis]|nr:Uncharacterised protein [Bordetella pertussis]
MPPPMPLASVMMSGITSNCWYANSEPVRPMPVCTSSTMNRMPCSSASLRRPCMNSRVAGITPASPCTGSSITATVCASIRARTESRSLISALGKPSTCGANIVSQPGLPEADMVASVRPWKPWFMVMIL